jgi:RNA polymerase sigma factor (sigma-70 family)
MKTNRRLRENASTPSQGEFEVFYNDHYRTVSRYVARRVAPSSHDEVVAATFVVAWQKFASASNPSLPWLYRIANYEVAHEYRRSGRDAKLVELNDLHLIDDAPMEDVFDVSKAFSQLSESDAELLRLVYWENLSRNEIAEVLGLSVNTVNVRYHRALDRVSGAVKRLARTARVDRLADPTPKEKP